MSIAPKYASHILGTGRNSIDLYLDYVCPFSKKLFLTVYKLTDGGAKVPSDVRFVFRHQIQPWHPSSTLVAEAGLAVAQVSPDKFWQFSKALFDVSDTFYDEAVYKETRGETYKRLAQLAETSVGVDQSQFLDIVTVPEGPNKNAGNKLQNELKYFIKGARQNSIHVSPTVLVNGIVDNSISSSFTTEQWDETIARL